jgi:hypothetical protein
MPSLDDSRRLLGLDPPKASRVPVVMLWRASGPLESLLACGTARRSSDGGIDLFLDAAEAARGGMITVSMQVDVQCPACGKRANAAPCAQCDGAGKVSDRFSAWLAVPPGIEDGSVLRPSVDLPGMLDRPEFRVRIRA